MRNDAQVNTLFITGGSRGIGAAVVVEAARAGRDVAFTYVARADAAAEVRVAALAAARQNGHDAKVCYWQLDVRDENAVDTVADEVINEFNGVHTVVCNAGVNLNGLAYTMQDEEWRTVIDTNLTGTFHVCRAFLPDLVAARRGRILVVSSVTAGGASGQIAYAASKAGVQGLAHTLAKEYGPKGITANVVLPGFFETDMTDAGAGSLRSFVLENTPLRRVGELVELARTIVFLASDDAGFINGAVIPVTGGMDWLP